MHGQKVMLVFNSRFANRELALANPENHAESILMKKHDGIRSHDVVILLKIVTTRQAVWYAKDIAAGLTISNAEVSESLHRSCYAGLIDNNKRRVFTQALFELLVYGLKYVFPQQPGAIMVGMPTSHSAPVLSGKIISGEHYVWPDADGTVRVQAIEPPYPTVPAACRKDSRLYDLLVLTDALRVGRVREQNLAKDLFKQLFDEYQRSFLDQPITN